MTCWKLHRESSRMADMRNFEKAISECRITQPLKRANKWRGEQRQAQNSLNAPETGQCGWKPLRIFASVDVDPTESRHEQMLKTKYFLGTFSPFCVAVWFLNVNTHTQTNYVTQGILQGFHRITDFEDVTRTSPWADTEAFGSQWGQCYRTGRTRDAGGETTWLTASCYFSNKGPANGRAGKSIQLLDYQESSLSMAL